MHIFFAILLFFLCGSVKWHESHGVSLYIRAVSRPQQHKQADERRETISLVTYLQFSHTNNHAGNRSPSSRPMRQPDRSQGMYIVVLFICVVVLYMWWKSLSRQFKMQQWRHPPTPRQVPCDSSNCD